MFQKITLHIMKSGVEDGGSSPIREGSALKEIGKLLVVFCLLKMP